MRSKGHGVINYTDNFFGFSTPSMAASSSQASKDLIQDLGLTISQKKLVPSTIKAICLGV